MKKNMHQFSDTWKIAEGSSAVNPVLITKTNNTVVCRKGRDDFVYYSYSKFLIQRACMCMHFSLNPRHKCQPCR